MRYRLIKRIINKVYIAMVGVHGEIEKDSLRKKLGKIGNNSKIMYPFAISLPENVYVGDSTYICENSRLDSYSIDGEEGKIIIGDRCYLSYGLSILAGANVIIGNDVLMASNILITSENHGTDPLSDTPYMNQPLQGKPIRIGDGCWIGEKVQILPGVSVGEKSIIGAGSIVTKHIPAYSVAVGNPAKVVKSYNFHNNQWESINE